VTATGRGIHIGQIDGLPGLGGGLVSWRIGDDVERAPAWRLTPSVSMAGVREIEDGKYHITKTNRLLRKNFVGLERV